jgi:hypothetical protein
MDEVVSLFVEHGKWYSIHNAEMSPSADSIGKDRLVGVELYPDTDVTRSNLRGFKIEVNW